MTRGGRLRAPAARAALATVLTSAAIVGPATTAGGETPSSVGWWTSANPGVSSGPAPTFVPSGGPGNTPSDVPPGGLEVANLPADTSYAALGYATSGRGVAQVVLKLAPDAANVSGSQVQACPLTGTGNFTPAYGAPLSEGPPYDCATNVAGVEDPSQGAVTFAVGRFVHDDHLGIAIVAVGTGRMVFNPPDQSTIRTTGASSAAQPDASTALIPDDTVAPAVGEQPIVAGDQPLPAVRFRDTTTAPAVSRSSSLVPVTQSIRTIGAGSAVVGAFLVLLAALAIVSRNRRALATAVAGPATTISQEASGG